jgi:hypothetical protein
MSGQPHNGHYQDGYDHHQDGYDHHGAGGQEYYQDEQAYYDNNAAAHPQDYAHHEGGAPADGYYDDQYVCSFACKTSDQLLTIRQVLRQ